MTLQYRLGHLAGKWARVRRRLNCQYVRGYVCGMIERIFRRRP